MLSSAKHVMSDLCKTKFLGDLYYGLFRDDVKHRKVAGDLESAGFSHWDQSSAAPAKHRPRPPVSFAADAQMLALFGPNRWGANFQSIHLRRRSWTN